MSSPPLHQLPVPTRRSSSAGRHSTFQIHTNNLVRKLGFLTNRLGASTRSRPTTTDDDVKEIVQTRRCRETRSMDLMRSKGFRPSPMLAVNFTPQTLDRRSTEDSSQSLSQLHAPGIGSDYQPVKRLSLAGAPAQRLTVATVVTGASLGPLVSQSPCSIDNTAIQVQKRTQVDGLPINTLVDAVAETTITQIHEANTVCSALSTNAELIRHLAIKTSSEPPSSSKRPVVPRLKTLPPLSFNLKGAAQDQKMLRLSPSVIVRPPPFPVLELPALPTPTAESPASRTLSNGRARPAARLNSMPMLPMEGRDERENDPDHEGYGLEEDDEGEEGEDGDDDLGISATSDDEDEDASGRPSTSSSSPSMHSGFLGRSRGLSFSPRLPDLLTGPTSSFSSLLGSGGSGPSTAAGAAHSGPTPVISDYASEAATPKAANLNVTGSATKRDYFSFSLTSAAEEQAPRDNANGSSESRPFSKSPTLRTPTACDYSQTPTRMQPKVYSVAPSLGSDARLGKNTNGLDPAKAAKTVGTPRLSVADSETAAACPGLYQQASKSMVELFSPAAASPKDSAAFRIAGEDIKGKGKRSDAGLHILHIDSRPSSKDVAPGDKMDPGTLLNGSTNTITGSSGEMLSVPSAASSEAPLSSIRRQRSMPTFNTSGPPPPYPTFLIPGSHSSKFDRFMPVPREDEGKEVLPAYSNTIHLAAIMPRKMEFTAPGVPARDRKWRRVHCVLEGTAFNVYDAPPRVSGVSAIGGWWERKVGVGDVSLGQTGNVVSGANGTSLVLGKREPKRAMKWEEELQAEEQQSTDASAREDVETATGEVHQDSHSHKSKRHIAASFLHPNRSRISLSSRSPSPASPRSSLQNARSSADVSSQASSAPSSARPSTDFSSTGSSTSGSAPSSSTSYTTVSSMGSHSRRHGRSESAQVHPQTPSQSQFSPAHARSHSQPLHQMQSQSQNNLNMLPEPDPKDFIRIYSLQRSESGLASDYTKRKNVVRVRMEGEQFLLQCTDVAGVVEWIEGLQAAANIALDLDERPMPKGPIFPRRRRRRRQQRAESAANQATQAVTS